MVNRTQGLAVPRSVLVVEDDDALRESFCELLHGCGYNATPLATAAALLRAAQRHQGVACILLDLGLPDLDGLSAQRSLAHLPHLPVIILSGTVQVPDAVLALRQGAIEVFEKPVDWERLLVTIEAALHVSHEHYVRSERKHTQAETLSPREHEVMQGLLHGKKITRIARELGISPSTAEKHRAKVLRKLRVDSVVELIRLHLPGRSVGAQTLRPADT